MFVESFETTEYLNSFKSSFRNFCDNAPLALSFSILGGHVHIDFFGVYPPWVYEIDFSLNPKENIAKIKNVLYSDYYPILTKKVTKSRSLTSQEITDLILAEDISFDDAVIRSVETVEYIDFRVEKIFHKKNLVQVHNLETDIVYLYEPKMPVAIIQEKFFRKRYNKSASIPEHKENLIDRIVSEGKLIWSSENKKENNVHEKNDC